MEANNNNKIENESIEIVFTEKLPDELQCKKCEQVLRFPQKLSCGHRFCAACIEGLHTCPECSALIDPAKLKLDKESQRRIQRLSVQCTFHDNGCEWKGELRELEGHALSCEKADTICPRGCGIIYPKSEETLHLESECTKKLQDCEYCGKPITVKGLKVHLKVCPEMIIDCPNSCGILQMTRTKITEHLPECPKAGSCCPFGEFGCEYKDGRENLQKHIKEKNVYHLSILCDGVIELKSFLSVIQLNSEKAERNHKLMAEKVEALEKLYGGQMIWRIDGVMHKIKTTQYSSPFLTGRHGYKLILSLHSDKQNDFVGLYITILPGKVRVEKLTESEELDFIKGYSRLKFLGDYDSLLTWPFTHKITLTLMDQNPDVEKRNHLSYVIKPYASVETAKYLNRPIDSKNAAFGADNFCRYEDFIKYIRDDVIFIKCNIDTENMILL